MATELVTTLGARTADDVGLILPHEHVFVDFRLPSHPDHAAADPSAVVALMAPEVVKARSQGVTAMVDCTPVGVGRRADIVKRVSEVTGMAMLVPTGIYREPWVPDWAHACLLYTSPSPRD